MISAETVKETQDENRDAQHKAGIIARRSELDSRLSWLSDLGSRGLSGALWGSRGLGPGFGSRRARSNPRFSASMRLAKSGVSNAERPNPTSERR
jgi:hypothetical protein